MYLAVLVIFVAVIIYRFILFVLSDNSTSNTDTSLQEEQSIPGSAEWKGQIGERNVSTILSYLPSDEYIVLNDVLLPTGNGTTQLDHVVVSLYGIFVIETKNYSGSLYGGKNSDQWIQYLGGKKYVFLNPILQNELHARAISNFTHLGRNHIIPLVVFAGTATIKASVSGNAVFSDQLYDRIIQYQEKLFTPDEILFYAHSIDEALVENIETKRAHIDSVQEKMRRRNQEISSGGCPMCDGYLVLRHGKFGQFYGCSNYPKCKYTKNIEN